MKQYVKNEKDGIYVDSLVCERCPIDQKCCRHQRLVLSEEETKLFPDKTKWPDYEGRLSEEEIVKYTLEADDMGIQQFMHPIINLPDGWCQQFDEKTRLCKLGDKRPHLCKFFVCDFMRPSLGFSRERN